MRHRFKATKCVLGAASGVLVLTMAASAQEEIYEYDALGRLVKVTQEDGSVIDYAYDPAGNRKRVDISGSGVIDSNPNGVDGAVIVVPLNGFTVIVVD